MPITKFLTSLLRAKRRQTASIPHSRRGQQSTPAWSQLERLEDRTLLTISFNFIYAGAIGSGIGFEDATHGQDRRDALEATATTLGGFFDETGTVDVSVSSINVTGTSTLASAGSSFFPGGSGEFTQLIAATKILTGHDLNGAGSDASLTVNWGNSFELEDDFQSGEFDFTSVIMHELSHVLGFNSMINQDGSSKMNSATLGNPGRWSVLDSYISDSTGISLIDPDSYILDPSWATHSVGGSSPTSGLFFNGYNAMTANGGVLVGLYSPTTWRNGSSASHLDTDNPTYTSLMMSHSTPPGLGARTFDSIEVGVWMDLGYNMVGAANSNPVGVPDIGASFETDEDTSFTPGDFLANDFDPDPNETETIRISSLDTSSTNGLVTLVGSGIQTNFSSTGPFNITDFDTTLYPINVSGLDGMLRDVNVTLNIDHPWDSNLDVFLISPNGTRVELFSDRGFNGDDFTNSNFSDQALVSINATTSSSLTLVPFTGSFRPAGELSDFNGELANGTWQLEITDDSPGQTGSLLDWSIDLVAQHLEYDPNGQFEFLNDGQSQEDDFEYTLSDENGNSTVVMASILVNGVVDPNQPPTIISSDTVDAAENQTAVIDVQSTDLDGETEGAGLSYTISGGVDQLFFNIDANTGVLTFQSAPDFENALDDDSDNVYEVEVTVTDSGLLTDVQLISVTVTDVAEGNGDLVPQTSEVLLSASTLGNQRTGSAGQRSVSAANDGRYVVTWYSDEGDGDGSAVFAQLYRADGSKVGSEFVVSTTTANDQQHPSVAMRFNGQFVIMWQSDSDNGPGVNWEIHAQRYLASGLPDGGEFVINQTTAGSQQLGDITYLDNGNIVVTWTGGGTGDGNGVFARIFDTSGNPVGNEFLVSTTTAGAQQNPSLVTDSAGGFAAVWHGAGTGDGAGVFFRRFDNTGTALTSEVLVNQTTSGTQETASVTQTTDGNFVVVWSGEGTGDANGIFARRVTAAGATPGNEILINSVTANAQISPTVLAGESNSFLAAWSTQVAGADYDISIRKFDGSNNPETSEQTVNLELANRQWNPSLAKRGSNYIIAWSGRGLEDTFGVFTREYDASLTAQTSEVLLSASTLGNQRTGSAGQRSVSAANDGRYVVTWYSDEGDGDGSAVFAQLYRADGSKVGSEFVVSTTTANDQQHPSVAMRFNGQFVIMWQSDSDNGPGVNWEIHAQRYLASGLPDGGEFVINQTTAGSQQLGDITYLDNGNIVVTWTGGGTGDGNGVFARIFDTSGNPVGNEFLVSTTTAGAQQNPSLVTDSAGGFAAVWHGAGTGDGAGVFFRRFDNTGTALTSEVLVNQTTSGTQETASVTQTTDGNFVVVWSGEGTGDANGIFARRVTAAGATPGNEILINSVTANAQISPTVLAGESNSFLAAWSTQVAGADYDISIRKFDGSNNPETSEQTVNLELANRQWNPSLAKRGSNYIIAWSGRGLEDTFGVFTREYANPVPIPLASPEASFIEDESNLESTTEVSLSSQANFGADDEAPPSFTIDESPLETEIEFVELSVSASGSDSEVTNDELFVEWDGLLVE
ncbi:Proprotein convertase P-domain protein [Polystyrenella longa]|uniref:Proprotein convertase P-domain protein n=1 Tax=Polystyrenella longa TaxID=2528007 RepID=A0A518CTK8_9PLAN|nr:proprotein convertase P-domain-containing protein [Polystyrenella longa]QDU82545.1 Proprotein convertase P-domain protein [Polystyrenella longa]